jgi:hypothetical protein
MYNLAKRAGKKHEKSVGLEVKLPANVMRTWMDLKQRGRAHYKLSEILNKKKNT